MELNSQQSAAAAHRHGHADIISGPGSGKTRVITAMVATLFREGQRPGDICCVTFSKDAAEEMRRRISKLTCYSETTLKDTTATFHSLAYRMILSNRAHLGFELADEPLVHEPQIRRALREYVSKDAVPQQRAYIARQRRLLISPEAAIRAAQNGDLALAEVYGMYDEWLREEGLIDFDSMVYRAVGFLESGAVKRGFRHVIVDECHDTSADQNRFAELLAGENGNLVRVYDPSQRIYSWRGAECALSVNGSRRYFLPTNYRSNSEIIEAFAPFAEQDELSQQLVRQMLAANGDGGTVTVREFKEEYDQACAVCEEIGCQGLAPEDSAVLARTKALLLPYCEILEEAKIPYFWRGKNFWKSPEIEEAIAFCRLAIDPGDAKAVIRACGSSALCAKYLSRAFGQAAVDTARAAGTVPMKIGEPRGPWRDYQVRQWREFRDAVASLVLMRNSKPQDFLLGMRITAGLGISDSQTEEPDDFAAENFQALVRRSEKFGTLIEFVRHAEKMANLPKMQRGVALSTIHSSKGLEWESVYVVGVTDKILPHKRSEDYEEERRLMYVALSRAKRLLWVSSHGERSVFLSYIPERFRHGVVLE